MRSIRWRPPISPCPLAAVTSTARRLPGWRSVATRLAILAATLLAAEGRASPDVEPPPGTPRSANSSASRSAASGRSSTFAPRCCCAPGGSGGGCRRGGGRRRRCRSLSIAASIAAAGRRRRQGQREGLHPGARRHRYHLEHDAHLYLRRAYGIGQALGDRSAHLRRITQLSLDGVRRTPARRSGLGGPPAFGDRRGGGRGGRAARRPAQGGAGRLGASCAALAPGPTGEMPRPPNSCLSTSNSTRPACNVLTWSSAGGRSPPFCRPVRPGRSNSSYLPHFAARSSVPAVVQRTRGGIGSGLRAHQGRSRRGRLDA